MTVQVAQALNGRGQYEGAKPEIYVPYTQYPWQLDPRNIMIRIGFFQLVILTLFLRGCFV